VITTRLGLFVAFPAFAVMPIASAEGETLVHRACTFHTQVRGLDMRTPPQHATWRGRGVIGARETFIRAYPVTSSSIIVATRAQQDVVTSLITLAFSTDPVVRWIFADPAVYLTHVPAYIQAFGGAALDHGTAFCIPDYRGAALWLPPGVSPDDDTLNILFARTVEAAKRPALNEVLRQMDSYHPAYPHYYLPLIGIDPCRQNQGLGSCLMRHAHALCDRTGLPAYLESSNENNLPFYQELGYARLGTIRVGSCPPVFPMLRRPQPASPT
jgi:GNAT superfamily N-acetyltransferase